MKEKINLLLSLLMFGQERTLKRLCLPIAILLMAVAPSYLQAKVSVGYRYDADNLCIIVTKEPTEIGGHWEGALDAINYYTSSLLTVPEEVYIEDGEDKILCKITQILGIGYRLTYPSDSRLTPNDIREIKIPKTVLLIQLPPIARYDMFHDYLSLENIYVDPDNPKYKSVDGVLFNIDETEIIAVPKMRETCTIPNSVKSIGKYAFSHCGKLQNLTIPNSVTSIGEGAFEYCDNITSLVLPEAIDTIIPSMFKGCASLPSVIIPSGVKLIRERAFEDCAALQTISLPESLKEIEMNAFAGCQALEAVNMPNSLTTLGACAFAGCQALEAVNMPNSLTTLGTGTFARCIALKQINLSESLTILPENVFYKCKSLESITIPENVREIGISAFEFCSDLAELTIPSSVEIIRKFAFCDCSSLMTINSHRLNPPRFDDNYGWPFKGVSHDADIYVPGNCTWVYRSDDLWGRFYNYHEVFEWGEREPDGITDVVADEDAADAPVYNTLGVRVYDSYKGLVIKNGKKYIQH